MNRESLSALEPGGRRIVINSSEYAEHRLFIANFDSQTGALTLDKILRGSRQRTAPGHFHGRQDLAARLPWQRLPARCGLFPLNTSRRGFKLTLGQRRPSSGLAGLESFYLFPLLSICSLLGVSWSPLSTPEVIARVDPVWACSASGPAAAPSLFRRVKSGPTIPSEMALVVEPRIV
jgi:hypothetical protein